MSALKQEQFSRTSTSHLCLLFGFTRQSYYQFYHFQEERTFEHQKVIFEVMEIRKDHPIMGVRKIHKMLKPFFQKNQIKMGRDQLFDLMADYHMLVRRRTSKVRTTNSNHGYRKYPNAVKNFTPNGPNRLWVSDITYWKVNGKSFYISFITDVFSRKIIGYNVADNMEAEQSIIALKMALRQRTQTADELIHHSDRGKQYCCSAYVELLSDKKNKKAKKKNIKISMTETGDPRDNSFAERVNGIIKNEYLNFAEVETLEQAKIALEKAVFLYNNVRPHMSINYKTPSEVHETNEKTKRQWKNYYLEKWLAKKDNKKFMEDQEHPDEPAIAL